jgi:hypothetical protein
MAFRCRGAMKPAAPARAKVCTRAREGWAIRSE